MQILQVCGRSVTLLKRIRKTNTIVWQLRSGRRRSERSSEGHRAQSGEQAERHRSSREISCETSILCSSVHRIIHHNSRSNASNDVVLCCCLKPIVLSQENTSCSVRNQQSAYRAYHSTETAVLKLLSDILLAVDNGDLAVLTLLDLSAAFDTVDYGILLHRILSKCHTALAVQPERITFRLAVLAVSTTQRRVTSPPSSNRRATLVTGSVYARRRRPCSMFLVPNT